MTAAQILLALAAVFFLAAVQRWVRMHALDSAARTWALVAGIFCLVALATGGR